MTSDRTSSAAPSGGHVLPLIVGAAVFALVLFHPGVLNDGDTWLHIAAGRWIIAHGAVPWQDPFSLTFAGRPWIAHEWLAEVLMGGAWLAGGLSLVLIEVAAAAALAAALLARHLLVWIDPAPALITLLAALPCIGPSLLARPHILALPALELWTAGLLFARARSKAPDGWLLPVMTLWANLHGSFPFGLALLLPLGLEAVLDSAGRRVATAGAWGGFAAASILSACLTPYGWHSLVLPVQLLRVHALSGIGEWQSIDFSHLQPLEFALLLLLAVGLSRELRVPPIRLAILLGLLHMALQHIRHEVLAAVVGALLLAEPLSRALPARRVGGTLLTHFLWPPAFAAVFACLAAGRLIFPAQPDDHPTTPFTALSHLPQRLVARPVFNAYGFGPMLIFAGIRPFIDSRAELYGDEGLSAYANLTRPDPAALARAFKDFGIAWTILAPNAPMLSWLNAQPGWTRLYADKFAVIHAHTDDAETP